MVLIELGCPAGFIDGLCQDTVIEIVLVEQ